MTRVINCILYLYVLLCMDIYGTVFVQVGFQKSRNVGSHRIYNNLKISDWILIQTLPISHLYLPSVTNNAVSVTSTGELRHLSSSD